MTRETKADLIACVPVALFGAFWVALLVLAYGCTSPRYTDVAGIPDKAKTLTQAAGGYAVLDWIFAACMVLAALSVVLLFVAPGKAKPWATAGLVAAGVMAVALKVLLVKYMGWIIGAGLVAFVLSGLVFAYAHRWWIERRLHKDLDGDGQIGEPKA